MRHYELMVILDPSLDERTVTPSLELFLNVVKNDSGTVEKIEVWGKRGSPSRSRSTPRASTRCSRSPASRPPSRSSTASWGSTSPCCAPRSCAASRSAPAALLVGRRGRAPATPHGHLGHSGGRAASTAAPAAAPAAGSRDDGRRNCITVVGNLTADPELRFTPSGCRCRQLHRGRHPRTFDRQTGEWKDGEALFMRCNVWRQAAENVAETLTRGMRVMVPAGCASGPSRPARVRSAPSSSSRSTRSAPR